MLEFLQIGLPESLQGKKKELIRDIWKTHVASDMATTRQDYYIEVLVLLI